MSRFLKLMSVLAIVALIAVPAFAEVQNVKVSGDIDSKMINRNNYDLGSAVGAAKNGNDTWFMSTVRLQIDADLTDNVSTCVRVLNERDWGIAETTGVNNNTTVDLDLAYAKLKEMFYAPLTMTIGRQNIRLGSGLVVGSPMTNDATSAASTIYAKDLSARKSFDAVRASFDYNPLVVDVIFAKINAGIIGYGNTNDDSSLYGVNAAYKFNKYNSEAEAYIIAKDARAVAAKSNTVDVYGIRGSLEPISKLVLNGELAMQRGTYSNTRDRSAWAADAAASYAIDYKWSPKVGVGYVYRSGDKAGNTGDYKGWDTMYEDQTHGIVANYIFQANNEGGDSNSQILTANASVNPVKDLTVAVDYYYFMLAQKLANLSVLHYNDGTVNTEIMTDRRELGQEVDLSLGYDYTEDVKLGLTAGFFLPGQAFSNANDSTASTVMADVKVTF